MTAGLPDDLFVTDGLLTKRVLRAYALAMLAPTAGDLLWDLGAGTGSIGIEWCRLHSANQAIAVERSGERADRIGLNAEAFAVTAQLTVIVDDTAATLPGLPRPDAVFIGGGVTEPVVQASWDALPPGGRLVAHSVTADSDAVLVDAYRRWSGDLTRIAVENGEPIGRFVGFKPLRTVTAWAVVKDATV